MTLAVWCLKKTMGKNAPISFHSVYAWKAYPTYVNERNTSWRSIPIYRGKTALLRQQCVVRRVVFHWQGGRIWLSLQIRLSSSAAHGRDAGGLRGRLSCLRGGGGGRDPASCTWTIISETSNYIRLKGLSHEIFGHVCWPVWMHLGLNKNRLWFLNFKEAPSIWDSHFKFWCVSVQTFSEILRISEKDWQLSQRFSEIYLNRQLLSDTLML